MRKILITLFLFSCFFLLLLPEADALYQSQETLIQVQDTTISGAEVKEISLISDTGSVIPDSDKPGFSLTSLLRGLLGMLVLILIAYIFSSNRKAISWRVVLIGLSIQISLAIGILYVPFIGKYSSLLENCSYWY